VLSAAQARRRPQQHHGTGDQTQGDERMNGQERDAGDVCGSGGIGWQADQADRHAQKEHGGQAHHLVAGQMPQRGKAGGLVLARDAVPGPAGARAAHRCLP
jgi:hypothetical protein